MQGIATLSHSTLSHLAEVRAGRVLLKMVDCQEVRADYQQAEEVRKQCEQCKQNRRTLLEKLNAQTGSDVRKILK